MQTKTLGQRQIFGMKRESLQGKVQTFYQDTQNTAAVVEYAIAVMIRNAFVIGDFSLIFAELIHEIYLHAEPTDLLRRFCPFFENYFDRGEWKLVKARMFKNVKEYHKVDTSLRLYKNYLQEKTTPVEELNGQQYKLISVFEDANGKLHTWNLGDADPNIAIEKADALLELLTTLTIFKKAGVRRFVKVEKSDIVNCTRKSLVQKKKVQEEAAVDEHPSTENKIVNSDSHSTNTSSEVENVSQALGKKANCERLPEKVAEVGALSEKNSNSTALMTEEQATSSPKKQVTASAPSQKTVYKKPKSEKQKKREYKDELIKETKYGKKKKSESRKKKKNKKEDKKRKKRR
ncbi:glycosyltransferase family 1 protein [Enterococcus sp. AZ196]|uniref:glycosyltransferase family 1 protein n=1 Tax=Enterococcus sp. AZ196 TaxID=2774659 RepID=UPI003D29ECA3